MSVGRETEMQIEALLVASPEPVKLALLREALPGGDLETALGRLEEFWSGRGMEIRVKDGAVSLVPNRTCLRVLSEIQGDKARKLSSAAVETLAYIALNQPVTLADIEKARGVKLFKGIIDSLLDSGLVRAAMRRTDSGRAATFVTTDAFLEHFGLASLSNLPTPEELEGMVGLPPQENDE